MNEPTAEQVAAAIANSACKLADKTNRDFAIKYSLRDGIDVNTAGRIAWHAVLVFEADVERKLRKTEARRAWMLAFKVHGVRKETTWIVPDDCEEKLVAETPEAKEGLRIARGARERYLAAAKYAGMQRRALNALLRKYTRPAVPDHDIAREYEALCERERDPTSTEYRSDAR